MAPSCIYNAAGIRGQSAQTCSSSVALQDFLRDCISSNLFKESRSERSRLRDPKKSEGCDWQGSVPAECFCTVTQCISFNLPLLCLPFSTFSPTPLFLLAFLCSFLSLQNLRPVPLEAAVWVSERHSRLPWRANVPVLTEVSRNSFKSSRRPSRSSTFL